jgi:hypothetical protein
MLVPMSSDWHVHGTLATQPSRVIGGLMRRIAASAGMVVGGAVFVLLYLAFWASRFAWYQNLAVLLSVALVVPAVIAVLWITWGLSIARGFLHD